MTRARINRFRLLAAAIATALLAMIGTNSVAGATSSPPHAAAAKQKLSEISLNVNALKVTSSRHQKLSLVLRADAAAAPFAPRTTAPAATSNLQYDGDVILSSAGGNEEHDWGFSLTSKMLSANPKKGTAKYATSKALGKFGSIKLTARPAGNLHQQHPCSSLTYTQRPVAISGSVRFDTQSGNHGWGVVKVKSLNANGSLDGQYGTFSPDCSSKLPKENCAAGIYATTYGSADSDRKISVGISADSIGKKSTLSVSRQQQLPSPTNASRYDRVTTKIKPLKIASKGGNYALKLAGASKQVSGSAGWTSPDKSSQPTPTYCKNKTTLTIYNGTFTNGSKPLSVKSAIFGAITIRTTNVVGGTEVHGIDGDFQTFS